MIVLDNRILLNNGVSIVSIETAAEYILKYGDLPDFLKVEDSFDAQKFEELYDCSIIADKEDSDIEVKYNHTDEEYDDLVVTLSKSPRHHMNDKRYVERYAMEMEFFDRNNYAPFLCTLDKLVKQFKADGFIWGVGRGSSCASYILFLLEVHDIDPVKYNIDFSEFSKEKHPDV